MIMISAIIAIQVGEQTSTVFIYLFLKFFFHSFFFFWYKNVYFVVSENIKKTKNRKTKISVKIL